MTPGFLKWSTIFVLVSLSVVFTQCGKPFAEKGDLIYSINGVMSPVAGSSAEDSLAAFEKTVYPVTRQYCVDCHGSYQQPKHASADVAEAHNAVLSQYKVNFSDPASSRLVKKLKEESHHCWTSCAQSAQVMQQAIEEWSALISTGGSDTPGETSDFSLVTDPSKTLLAERQAITSAANIITAQAGGAMLTSPMVYRTSTQPYYVEVPNDGSNSTLANNDASAGLARFTFSASVARTGGAMWGLVNATPNNDDSFFVGLNSANQTTTWNLSDTKGKFVWQRMPNNYNVVAGTNTLTIREREDGAQIAMVLWTSDQNLVPAGTGTAGQISLKYSLDKILGTAGASLELKIEDYDSYSYRLSGLKINNSTGRNIYVRNIRILVNGSYNPQHSNYTLVDQMVMNGGATLSPANMIVLKDQGETVDKFSFAFEVLEFR